MIKIVWEENALNRHEEWALNIALQFSFQHAQSYLIDIETAIINISNNPNIGIDHPTSSRKNLKRFVTGYGYYVYYDLDSSQNPMQAKIISVNRGQKSAPKY